MIKILKFTFTNNQSILNVLILFISLLLFSKLNSQSISNIKPKLVVGIVVYQMRYDYLYKYYNKYGDGGFRKLMNQGFNCKNNYYNYAPTNTGFGHASIFTGTSPSQKALLEMIGLLEK